MRNVVLVTIDSLRADHLSSYGYDRETSPVIDSLADGGARFENAFAHACSTRPSFPSILTSSYALMYGGYDHVSDEQTTVAEAFHDAGYTTGGFHSNLYLSADFGYDRGFDAFYDSKSDPSLTARARQAVRDNLDSDSLLYRALERLYKTAESTAGSNVGASYVTATDITDHALDWVRGQTSGDGNFLWVHYMDVHHPYVPPAEHQRVFRDDPIEHRRAIRLRRKMLESPDEITENELGDLRDLYDAEIHYADAEIGRLLDGVEEAWGDAITLVTADHGEEFLDHGGFSHAATFYDEVLHVPFVLDDGEHGGTYDDLVGLMDVAPSLVDAAGIDQPEAFHGNALSALFDSEWSREDVVGAWADTDSGEERYAYRDHRWKYIRRASGEELYDLDADPGETENRIDDTPEALEHARERVEEVEAEVAETRVESESVAMDEETRQRLRDLGYAE